MNRELGTAAAGAAPASAAAGGGTASAGGPVTVGATADGGLRVALHGEIDYLNADAVIGAARAAVDRHGPTAVQLDLADVDFLDSSGIAALVKVAQAARQAGATFALAAPRPRVLDQLRLTGLTELFPVVEPTAEGRTGPA